VVWKKLRVSYKSEGTVVALEHPPSQGCTCTHSDFQQEALQNILISGLSNLKQGLKGLGKCDSGAFTTCLVPSSREYMVH